MATRHVLKFGRHTAPFEVHVLFPEPGPLQILRGFFGPLRFLPRRSFSSFSLSFAELFVGDFVVFAQGQPNGPDASSAFGNKFRGIFYDGICFRFFEALAERFPTGQLGDLYQNAIYTKAAFISVVGILHRLFHPFLLSMRGSDVKNMARMNPSARVEITVSLPFCHSIFDYSLHLRRHSQDTKRVGKKG